MTWCRSVAALVTLAGAIFAQAPAPSGESAASGSVAGSILTKTSVKTRKGNPDRNLIVYLVPTKPMRLDVPKRPVVVIQSKLRFEPAVLPVVAGTKVRFENKDKVVHNVLCERGCNKIDKDAKSGESTEQTFAEPGENKVVCRIHPDMVLYVVALETPYFTTATLKRMKKRVDGKRAYSSTFELANVPPGEYVLHTWHRKLKPTEQKVVVEAGKPLRQELVLE